MVKGIHETPSGAGDDFFGLDNVVEAPEADAPLFLDAFLDCEGLMKACAIQDPAIKRSVLNNELTRLPAVQIGKDHQYQLEHHRDRTAAPGRYRSGR